MNEITISVNNKQLKKGNSLKKWVWSFETRHSTSYARKHLFFYKKPTLWSSEVTKATGISKTSGWIGLWFSFTISGPVHFKVNRVSTPSGINMWASSIAIFQHTRHVSTSQGSKILFFLNLLKKLFHLTSTLTFWL